MGLIHYSIAGATACLAAVGGVYLQVTLSQPETSAPDAKAEVQKAETGIRLPQIAVPIYSTVGKVGYCVMSVEYDGENMKPEDSDLVVPRVTNDLYIEFGSALPENADPVKDCENRIGKRTDTFVIYSAEFYERIDQAGG